MRKIIRLCVGVMLIFISLGFFFYPDFRNWKIREEVNRVEEEIKIYRSKVDEEEAMPYKNEITEEELYLEMKKYNQRLVTDGQELVDVWSYEETPIELKHLKDVNQVIGYIEIPDMKVKLPLLIGASEENLAKGAGILSETSMPVGGENTNSVIENMKNGSIVYLHTLWETRVYKTVDVKIVDSFDLESILIQEEKDMVTLMSCHPYGVPGGKFRYLVYCEYVE